jgi:hypothetical protein
MSDTVQGTQVSRHGRDVQRAEVIDAPNDTPRSSPPPALVPLAVAERGNRVAAVLRAGGR